MIFRLLVLIVLILALPVLNIKGAENDMDAKDKGGLKIIKTTRYENALFAPTRPTKPQYAVSPLFTVTDKHSKFMMQIGGFVKPIIGWDIGNVLDDISFIPAQIPVSAASGNKAGFFLNPMHSSLSFHILGLPGSKHEVGAYVQMMYNAPKSTVQVHHVYVTYAGLLLGRTTTLFADGESMPETIDPQGPNGAVSTHSYQFSYQHHFRNGIGLGISLELPTFDRYGGKYADKDYPDLDGKLGYGNASQPIPDIPLYVEYKGKGKNRIRLSGILRNFFYYNEMAMATNSRMGWGVQLSGNLQPVKPLVLYYQGTYGKGIGYYIQDLSCLAVSFIPSHDRLGKMQSTPMMGWLGGFSYRFPSKITLGGMYSQARVWKTSVYNPDYKLGQYVAANLFYPIRDYFTFGFEYLWGDHEEYADKSAHLNRVQAMLKFNF